MSRRKRPASVPPEARWSDDERAWIAAALDDEGRRHGLLHAWLADGALAERSLYQHGKRNGLQVFYRVEPPRIDVLSRVHQDIARVELQAADDNYGTQRYFDGDDTEVNERGVKVPPRPAGVPQTASYVGQAIDCWFEFLPYARGRETVRATRSWDAAGTLRRDANWSGDGWRRTYHENGALAEEGQRDEANDKVGPWRALAPDGAWLRTEHYRANEMVALSEHVPAGRYRGAQVTHREGAVRPLGFRSGFLAVGRWSVRGGVVDGGGGGGGGVDGSDEHGRELASVQLGAVGSDDELLELEALQEAAGERGAARWLVDADRLRDSEPCAALCTIVRAFAEEPDAARAAFDAMCAAASTQLTDAGRRDLAAEVVASYDDWRQDMRDTPLKRLFDALLWGARPGPLLLRLAGLLVRVGRPARAHDFIEAACALDDDIDHAALQRTRAVVLRDLGDDEGADRALDAQRPARISREELRLLEAIAAAPEDDEPRMVYADWLTQRDDPRGAFIVAQCQLAALDDKIGDDETEVDETGDDEANPRREQLERTQREIFEQHASSWLPPAELDLRSFERGMLGDIAIPGDAFCDDPDALYRLAPDARVLRVDTPYDPIRLSKTPEILRYRGFDLSDTFIDADDYRHLASSPFFANLEQLRFYNASLGDEELGAFCRSPHLGKLRALDISCHRDNDVTVEGIRALVASTTIGRLHELDVSRLWLDDEAFVLICESESMCELRELFARCNRFGPAVHALKRFSGRLRLLDLAHNGLDEQGLRQLVQAEALCELQELYLSANELADEGARIIASAPLLSGLVVLELDAGLRSKTGGAGAGALAAAPTLAALRSLSLSMNQIGDEGAVALAAGEIVRLQRLDLYQNGIGDEGAIALARSEVLGELRWLNLDANNIGERGARALARSTKLDGLRMLRLAGNDISQRLRDALLERFEQVTFRYPWGGPD